MSQFDRGVGTYWPTACSDPRCTTTQTCQRAQHERYGNAPGENYGPQCVPLPPPARTAEEERAAVVAWLRAEAEAYAGTRTGQGVQRAKSLALVADNIERGEHRREGDE